MSFDCELSVFISAIEVGFDFEIPQVLCGGRPQVNIPKDPAHPPHILVFEVRPIAPAEILDSEQIVSCVQIASDIEFDRGPTVFAKADLLPVDPKEKE